MDGQAAGGVIIALFFFAIGYWLGRKKIRIDLKKGLEMLEEDVDKAKKWLRDKLD